MDGVICNNNDWHRTSWMAFAKQLGKELTDDDIETKVYGKTNEEILGYVLGRKVTEEENVRLAEEKEAMFRLMYDPHFALTKGLLSFLERLKSADIPIGLGTNAPLSNLNYTLEKGQIGAYYQVQINPDMVANPKPAPDIYLAVAHGLRIVPENCIVFEDSFGGIAAAKAAGCKVVGIDSTYPKERLSQVCDYVISDFDEMTIELFQQIISNA